MRRDGGSHEVGKGIEVQSVAVGVAAILLAFCLYQFALPGAPPLTPSSTRSAQWIGQTHDKRATALKGQESATGSLGEEAIVAEAAAREPESMGPDRFVETHETSPTVIESERRCALLDQQIRRLLGMDAHPDVPSPVKFGWYSPTRAAYDTHVYLAPDDTRVEVTTVTSGYEPRGGYSQRVTDARCVGPVLDYVRRGRLSASTRT